MDSNRFPLTAGGDVNPCRFVMLGTATPFTVLQADAGASSIGARTVGIAQEGAKAAPIDGASTLAAASGDPIKVFGDGEICILELGTGGATQGDLLKSDANGKGITTTTGSDLTGARCLRTGAAGELVEVLVESNRKV